MLVGAHVSPAGGPANAVARGEERGAQAIQFFNQNPRAWRAREYTEDELEAYHAALAASDVVEACVLHAVYLINCASEDAEIRAKSLNSLTIALRSGAA
ncbi:MAG: deoxyribonuclease, partial [Solirubrobacteraceae bacterium]|nr:deoxyribonuclease [Solirubrobacteraceae bacterium]